MTKSPTFGQSRRSGRLSRRRSLASWRSEGPLRRHHTPRTPAAPSPSIASRRTHHQQRRGHTRPALSMATGTALGYSVRSNVNRVTIPSSRVFGSPQPSTGVDIFPGWQDRDVLDPYRPASHVGDLHVGPDVHFARSRSKWTSWNAFTCNQGHPSAGSARRCSREYRREQR